jgi:alanyl-tRNA synthetase
LLKELAEKESTIGQTQATEDTSEVEGVVILKRDFGEIIDVTRMVQTASEVIKRNDDVVTVYYGSDGKTCRIMIMAGDSAIKKGINAGNIIKEVAPIFGGGGGGRPNFAQGGGTKCDKLKDTIQAAEDTIKKQLKPQQ